ncbi:phosphatidylserine/phosphatidylglycerophosphate/cardiolipin synthase family protein [Pandoraea sp. SD6-2]|uniref:phospholipase D-like domain-containing protein n=1 Tax=Pandoraea sp. SD6-2 TaxID=1286093 RepID=UPI00056A3B5A|nr:phospholipase D family protein [Pandoraea sp. SD6-2]
MCLSRVFRSHRRRLLQWRRLAFLPLALFVVACSSVRPPPLPSQWTSHTPAATPGTLASALAPSALAHPGQSGFQLLATGSDAFTARLALVQSAQHSLDVQYYSAGEDITGRLLLQSLLDAAARGVRVRMLIDDINRRHTAPNLAVLDQTPNIEIRVFNPFGTLDTTLFERAGNLLTQFNQLNRRMHNKALVADNQVAIVGGRNLGDEYFDANPELSFRDFDLLCAGPVVDAVSRSFDHFWTSPQSYPLKQVQSTIDQQTLDGTREALARHWQDADSVPASHEALHQPPLAESLRNGKRPLFWAPAELAVDSPDKLETPAADTKSAPGAKLRQLAANAKREVLIVSPYFVPLEGGVRFLSALTQRGVKVRVLTNSLAATDVVPVHAGYARYRPALVQAGIELYEFKPIRADGGGLSPRRITFGGSSRATLHGKVYVIDRRDVILGSFNLDPRSARLNTELAIVIHSPEFAERMAGIFERAASARSSFRVELAPPGATPPTPTPPTMPALRWVGEENGQPRTFDVEPYASFWRNSAAGAFMLLPSDDLL